MFRVLRSRFSPPPSRRFSPPSRGKQTVCKFNRGQQRLSNDNVTAALKELKENALNAWKELKENQEFNRGQNDNVTAALKELKENALNAWKELKENQEFNRGQNDNVTAALKELKENQESWKETMVRFLVPQSVYVFFVESPRLIEFLKKKSAKILEMTPSEMDDAMGMINFIDSYA